MSYNTNVYMEQGGNALVCTSSGHIRVPVVNQTSGSTTIMKSGISYLDSTVANTMNVDPPVAGCEKIIGSFSTLAQTVRFSTDLSVYAGSTASKFYSVVLTCSTIQEETGCSMILKGLSTARWLAILGSNTSAITFSTACT